MKHLFLPTLLGCFAILSITTLNGFSSALAQRQFIYFFLGFGLFFFFQNINFSRILSWSYLFYGISIILLVVALIFSSAVRSTHRWISLGFFNLQPSQLAILSLALVLARLMSIKKNFQRVLIMLIVTLPPTLLTFLEPDLSMTLLILVVAASIIWLQPIPNKIYLFAGVLFILLSTFSWLWLLQPYQKERIESFLRPKNVSTAAVYNVNQSKIAVGSGKLFGKGMRSGTQSQLRFLPEKETDFIFAAFSEETGWLGSMLVVGLYASLLTYLLRLAKKTKSIASKTFLISSITIFLAQVSINIGMNIGLLPVTGIALPLLSYGGSSLLMTSLILGISQSIAANTTHRLKLQIE